MKEMYDLVQVGESSYYIYCPTNMGLYLRDNGKAVVFDSGNSSNVGKTIRKILDAQGWELDCIINTHAHADHISGNDYLQRHYQCPIFASPLEIPFIENTTLLPSVIFGGAPPKKLLNSATYAKPSVVFPFTHRDFPSELEIIDLQGHSPGHVGIRTPDDVVYVGDAYVNADILDKYSISFIYELEAYLASLKKLEGIKAACFVAAHDSHKTDIREVVQRNRSQTEKIREVVKDFCTGCTMEEIFQKVDAHFHIQPSFSQYFLNTHTIKAYLTYLLDHKLITAKFAQGRLLWTVTDSKI